MRDRCLEPDEQPAHILLKKRIVARDRIETLSEILNRAANESLCFTEFRWLVTDRLATSGLPDIYLQAVTNRFVGQMWDKFQRDGFCTSPLQLRLIEANLKEIG